MTKTQKIIYWVSTIWISFGMLSGGIFQLMHMPDAVKSFQHLGYPEYLLTYLGIAKILSVVALWIPGYNRLREWAYAGIFFVISGALFSHLYMKDSFGETFPAVLTLVLVLTSWYVRPADKKL